MEHMFRVNPKRLRELDELGGEEGWKVGEEGDFFLQKTLAEGKII